MAKLYSGRRLYKFDSSVYINQLDIRSISFPNGTVYQQYFFEVLYLNAALFEH